MLGTAFNATLELNPNFEVWSQSATCDGLLAAVEGRRTTVDERRAAGKD